LHLSGNPCFPKLRGVGTHRGKKRTFRAVSCRVGQHVVEGSHGPGWRLLDRKLDAEAESESNVGRPGDGGHFDRPKVRPTSRSGFEFYPRTAQINSYVAVLEGNAQPLQFAIGGADASLRYLYNQMMTRDIGPGKTTESMSASTALGATGVSGDHRLRLIQAVDAMDRFSVRGSAHAPELTKRELPGVKPWASQATVNAAFRRVSSPASGACQHYRPKTTPPQIGGNVPGVSCERQRRPKADPTSSSAATLVGSRPNGEA